ncbi:hypothetical protein HK102_006884 [Quaeritorhiza haematococci]|nr:hypothetical protein HK102_006884 [Quaeritorhiza haematococci]
MDDLLARFRSRIDTLKSPRRSSNSVAKLQRAWEQILFDCRLESNWTRQVQLTDIPGCLQQIVDMLVKEHAVQDGGVETGGCTELFLNNDMLADLVRISENDVPVGFRAEVIHFLSSLISLLDGNILIQNAVHRPALHLMRVCLTDKDRRYEDEMLELEYNIASKIHEFPQLLYIFFTKNFIPRNVSKESAEAGKLSSSTTSLNTAGRSSTDSLRDGSGGAHSEYEFLLFDHLLQYVHLEGRRGDFARTACLFLVELATDDLGEYISESDFSSVVIAGLGGLFSQLPQTLPVALRDGGRGGYGLQTFREDLDSFLRLLDFVQDVLLKCPSASITNSILTDMKLTFLDNIVQSSLTSASDFDGTTVAGLYYIQQMLDVVHEDRLSALFCHFLLRSDDDDDVDYDANDGELQLALRDILISKLNSLSEEVVTATLRVFQTLLMDHSRHSLHLLIEKLPDKRPGFSPYVPSFLRDPGNTSIKLDINQHLRTVSRYFSLIPNDLQSSTSEQSLEAYLQDAEATLAAHDRDLVRPKSAFTSALSPRTSSLPMGASIPPSPTTTSQMFASRELSMRGIDDRVKEQMEQLGRDSTLRKFINKFATFFMHTYEINLALTGVVSQLVAQPEPMLYLYMFSADTVLGGEENQSLFTVLVKLMEEVDERRSQLPDYDKQLAATRAKLFSGDGGLSDRQRRAADFFSIADLDLDAEFLKNVVLLEETLKELLAILIMHGAREYDQISYI